MNLNSQSTSDVLLFIARTFFLPPADYDVVPKVDMASMNDAIPSNHPWVELLRSLTSLCTLQATANNVVAIMILPSGGPEGQQTTIENVNKVQFLCADNWDKDPAIEGEVPHFVEDCLHKILEASKFGEHGNTAKLRRDMDDFIFHVYRRGWQKLCQRVTKVKNRGDRLLDTLRGDEGVRNGPPGRHDLVKAVSDTLTIIKRHNQNTNWKDIKKKDCIRLHEACTRASKALSGSPVLKRWLIRLKFTDMRSSCTPADVLQKMLKLRNGIENIKRLIIRPDMKPTFRGAWAARQDDRRSAIQWLYAPKLDKHDDVDVNLDQDASDIKTVYANALSTRSESEQRNYATPDEIKLCCEPCFTAIRAVNELLHEKLQHDFKFTAEGSHRKIYPGFAITPTTKLAEEDLIKRFNTILCCDIGTMVKAGAEKGLGHSDSAPEPGSGDE
ncbi:hypothetical protein V8D89_001378 [Ganoderma adspersum]